MRILPFIFIATLIVVNGTCPGAQPPGRRPRPQPQPWWDYSCLEKNQLCDPWAQICFDWECEKHAGKHCLGEPYPFTIQNDPMYPGGCYQIDGHVYYNEYTNGPKHIDAAPICWDY